MKIKKERENRSKSNSEVIGFGGTERSSILAETGRSRRGPHSSTPDSQTLVGGGQEDSMQEDSCIAKS
ncbi:hypothetical protein J6590_029992 [Homalodisca vitripennis]|nr:hypothetical protein J6590_029992 [Homalodisca vitripennis]